MSSYLFRGTYRRALFSSFLSLSFSLSLSLLFFTGGFVNAGASETQRLGFYTGFYYKNKGEGEGGTYKGG